MVSSRHVGAILMVGLVLTACDDPVRPDHIDAGARPEIARAAPGARGIGGPELIPNRIRYRESGARPARGRSGNVELQARALLASDGTAQLDVATGDFNGWGSTGSLTNVQVSLLDEGGRRVWTRAYQSPGMSTASYRLPGAGPGAAVRVQGTVKHSWGIRTGVVTLSETVRRRPDLVLADLYLPPEARLRVPTLVEAVVRERNGEVGAEATCALYVDGVQEDWMPWVWVDAGGVVTCAFMVVFRSTGIRTVRVEVRDVNPRDWDESNNAMEGTVEVSGEVRFEWWAGTWTHTEPFRHFYRSDHRATNAHGVVIFEDGYVDESFGQWQLAGVNGWLPARISFPLQGIYLRQETGGQVIHSQTLTGRNPTWVWEEEDYGEACLSAWGRGPVLGYAWLNLCTGYGRSWDGSLEEWTWVDYGRNAGDVTYHSSGYSRYFDEVTGEEFYYSWNYDDAMSEPGFLPYGENYTLEIRVTEGGSEYPILAVVPLESWTSEWEEPYTCFGWFDDWTGWTFTYCSEASSYEHGLSGWASSFGF